jgi:hypothetical protein
MAAIPDQKPDDQTVKHKKCGEQMDTMDNKTRILIIIGILITIVLFVINIYAAGIFFIIFAVLLMSFFIMKDSAFLPDVVAELTEDAKSVIIRNSGNAVARNIHVALVPENIEFDIGNLEPDASMVHPMDAMIRQAKAVITFENERSNTFSRTYQLTPDGGYDPLKPMIPIFRYK